MIKRRREREKLQDIFEARLRYEKSRKYIKQVHERLLRERNSREPKINYTTNNPYDDNPLDSARDHLYLIIPTNPSSKFKNKNLLSNQKDGIPAYLNADMSIQENSSIASVKHHLINRRQNLDDKLSKITNATIPANKPRERSKRLYNRRDDIYLPDISKTNGAKRGRSMFNLHNKKPNVSKNISPERNKAIKNLKASQSKDSVKYQSPPKQGNYDRKLRAHANTNMKKATKPLIDMKPYRN